MLSVFFFFLALFLQLLLQLLLLSLIYFHSNIQDETTDDDSEAGDEPGKRQCPKCQRWVKDKNHQYKCWKCTRCSTFVTNKNRHLRNCKGEEAKASKVNCPLCPVLIHPNGYLRHISTAHPSHLEKYRKRAKQAKTLSEKRQARKRFYEAHPEKVFHFKNNRLGYVTNAKLQLVC